jgi:hypothetical protein
MARLEHPRTIEEEIQTGNSTQGQMAPARWRFGGEASILKMGFRGTI